MINLVKPKERRKSKTIGMKVKIPDGTAIIEYMDDEYVIFRLDYEGGIGFTCIEREEFDHAYSG